MNSYPVALDVKLNDFERQISTESVEVCAAFDLEGDLALRPRSGLEDKVSFAPSEAAWLKNRVVTHNHPSGSSLSPADAELAVLRNVAELRAVCPDGTVYTLTRPLDGWPPVDEMVEAADHAYTAILVENVRRRLGGQTMLTTQESIRVGYETRRLSFARLGVILAKTSVWS